jgi:hypothetical protein
MRRKLETLKTVKLEWGSGSVIESDLKMLEVEGRIMQGSPTRKAMPPPETPVFLDKVEREVKLSSSISRRKESHVPAVESNIRRINEAGNENEKVTKKEKCT